MYTVYLLTDNEGREYVGCTCQPLEIRLRNHEALARKYIHPQSIGAAIARSGIGAFSVAVLGVFGVFEEAVEAERQAILVRGTMHPRGYNMRKGGCGFGRHRKRISIQPDQRRPSFPALTAAAPLLPRVGAAATLI